MDCDIELSIAYSGGAYCTSHRVHPSHCARLESLGKTVKLSNYGCVVWLDGGVLFGMEAGEFETYGVNSDRSYEVTAPISQKFLNEVNRHFGTTFAMDEFAGR